MLTRFGNPVGTITTLRPFGRVRSVAANGMMSLDVERPVGAYAARAAVSYTRRTVEARQGVCVRYSGFKAGGGLGQGLGRPKGRPLQTVPYKPSPTNRPLQTVPYGASATAS